MLISLPRKEETGKSSFFRISQSTFNATTILTSLIVLDRREEGIVRESTMRHTMCTRYGINAFSNPFATLLVSLDGQNNYKVFFEMLQLF